MSSPLRQKSRFSTVAIRVLLSVTVCLLAAATFIVTKGSAQSAPAAIATSQKLYSVGETMVVNGTGFSPNAYIYMSVLRPDHVTDSVLPLPMTNGAGVFTASYTPPLIPGRYTITATDGSNTAVTAVTEADAIGYNKGVYNKSVTAPEDTTGNWTTGNAGSNYLENQWSFYQYEVTGIGSTVPSFDVAFNHFQSNTKAVFIDALADIRACIDCTDSSHTSGPSQGMLLDTVPLPPSATTNWVVAASALSNINRPLNTAADGSGTTVLSGSSGFCSSNTPEPIPDMVTTFPAEFHCFHVDGPTLGALFPGKLSSGTHTITLYYAAHLAASFVWGNGSPGTGGHEASLGDCTSPFYVRPLTGPLSSFEPLNTVGSCIGFPVVYGTDDYAGWTAEGFGVGFATGSSRHFSLSNQSAGSSGAIELPIPTVAAPQNTIIIRKVTIPANTTGVIFPYTSSQLGNFSLTSPFPSSQTFTGIAGGVEYDVTEGSVAGWSLNSLSCAVTAGTDDGTGTFVTSGPTAQLTLGATDSGVTVTCTYTNSGSGHIIVQKHTIPSGSSQSFAYTTTGTGYTGFSLKDGGSNTDGGTPPAGGLTPGAYTINETGVAGWVLTSRTCSLTTTGSGTSSFPASGTTQPASITLGAGDTVTCVYTNTQPDARITLNPPSATNAVGSAHTFTATVQQNTGSGFVNAPDGTLVTFSLLNNTAGASFVGPNTCTTTAGSCSISVNSTTAGSVNIQATTTFSVLGVSLTRTTGDGLSGDSGNSTKTWVDLKISINPLTATNEVNTPHTFTATVQQNPGTGFVNVPDGTLITFSLSNNTANASFVAGNTCTTTGGSCPITITGTQAGSVTITASSTVTVSGVTLTRTTGDGLSGDSPSAVKTFISSSTQLTLKSAPTSVEAGALVTIVVTETNTGSGPLTNVNVTGGGACASFSPASVTLAAGASQDFTCTFTAAAGPNAWSALGHGTDSLGNPAPAAGESQSGSVLGLLSNLIVVKNTVGGNGTFQFAGFGTGVAATFPIATSGGTGMIQFLGIHSGPKTVAELVPTGWLGNTTNVVCTETALAAGGTPSVIGTLTTGPVAAGSSITANVGLGIGSTVTCVFTNTLLPTLTIIKQIQGTFTGATFSFDVSGANTLGAPTTNLTPSSSPGSATFGPQIINIGSSTIDESTPLPVGYTLTDASCVDTSGFGTITPGTLDSNGVPVNITFNAVAGSTIICTYVNNNAQATRTQGFWSTHTALANEVWGGNGTTPPAGVTPVTGSPDAVLCGVTITALPAPPGENVLMGGFWANVANTSTKGKRSSIDHARMVLLQQYLAAVLNVHMFGSGSEAMLVAARTAYCGTDQKAIQAETGILDTFNSQGDNLGTTPGGSATPSVSKSQADIDAWDVPLNPQD